MLFILSLFLAVVFVLAGRGFIKKHPHLCYFTAIAFAGAVFAGIASGMVFHLPAWLREWAVPLFSRGAFPTALFVIVMYTGALPNSSRLIRVLMPVRAELSILASLLTLTHNAAYGITYFKRMFLRPELLPPYQLAAGIITIILLCLMLPLTVTSFPSVRRRMNGKRWKSLQRSAYLFYTLLYLHVILLSVPPMMAGRSGYSLTVLAYSVVFIGYGAMRVQKALKVRKLSPVASFVPVASGLVLLLLLGVFILNINLNSVETGSKLLAAADQKEQAVKEKPVSGQVADSRLQQEQESPAGREEVEELSGSQPEEAGESQPAGIFPAPEKNEQSVDGGTAASSEKPAQAQDKSVSENRGPVSNAQTEAKAPGSSNKISRSGRAEEEDTGLKSEKEPAPQVAAEVAAPSEKKSRYRDGAFTGTGKGYVGDITVKVTVKADKITHITITDSSEDEPYFSAAAEITGAMLSAQSAAVDTVSGATYSSEGIIQAVRAALKKAEN
ncbi:sulfoxide reductase heme-binding subunit YedZ [Ruminiclostridium hungatei]|uniref:Sulfoxide reductase heme-binding subunit YedZ n=1 Tax=Ruminiclostridium hungatei TaxID=48256 RepID=A0A1V4SPP3_RUMHU|nr:FMN-binding protein [Ruminiclostridium hungatei]OPX45436.1 sulfoxide reductase heme-binding subunit YedZ [Ruminiclostridium hungatei]